MSVIAYIGLGSNLDNPADQVLSAIGDLQRLPSSQLTAASSLYCSAPVGHIEQDDFINAVAIIETTLQPLELLNELQQIESRHHRQRLVHWGPRTLDLDLLLYGDLLIDLPRLRIPHPEMIRRRFVMEPLLELNPDIEIPHTHHSARSILAQLQDQQLSLFQASNYPRNL